MKIYPDAQIETNSDAHAAKLSARKIQLNVGAYPDRSPDLVKMDIEIAGKLEKAADEYLTLNEIPQHGMGGEFIAPGESSNSTVALALKNPDRVNLDASIDRVELAYKNGVLNMALDTAETIGARNTAEQMLAHQMAVAHRMSLDLMAQVGNTRDPVEKCRLINAAARLMDTYQKAMLTIHRMHTGGQQTVTVQHVQINEGGQAVVNGSLLARGTESGGMP